MIIGISGVIAFVVFVLPHILSPLYEAELRKRRH